MSEAINGLYEWNDCVFVLVGTTRLSEFKEYLIKHPEIVFTCVDSCRPVTSKYHLMYTLTVKGTTLRIVFYGDTLYAYIEAGIIHVDNLWLDERARAINLKSIPEYTAKREQATKLIADYERVTAAKVKLLGLDYPPDEFKILFDGRIRLVRAVSINGVYHIPPFVDECGYYMYPSCDLRHYVSCFENCEGHLKVINENNHLESMSGMFARCLFLTSLDLTEFSVTGTRALDNFFEGCTHLTHIEFGDWNTSACTTMARMFIACIRLTSLDISNWDVSNVTDMSQMFANCDVLASLDLSDWNVNNVQNMQQTFKGLKSLEYLGTTYWNVSEKANTSGMFADCNKQSV